MMRLVRLGIGLALVGAAPAWAQAPGQSQLPGPSNVGKPRFQGTPNSDGSNLPPPPALPGAKTPFEPAEKTALDLPPTEALFDAINRGDIASARDAISRGADLSGRNVLGMSPLELSVDLSRNDITFLLLSLRGADATRPAAMASNGAAVLTKPATAAPPQAKLVAARPAPLPASPRPLTAAAAQVPRPQGGAGTPDPAAGFLGFGGAAP